MLPIHLVWALMMGNTVFSLQNLESIQRTATAVKFGLCIAQRTLSVGRSPLKFKK